MSTGTRTFIENNEEVLVGEHMINDCEVFHAKLAELGKWKANKVYVPVLFTGQKCIHQMGTDR